MLISPILVLALGLFSRSSSADMAYTGRHPFYVSVTEIQDNSNERILEVTCKIFTDDFEKALRKNYNVPIDLLAGNNSSMGKLINGYISAHLQISVDDKPCLLQYIGYEKDEEAVDCYFQVNDIMVNKTVTIMNDMLFSYKPEQVNIVHVTVRGIRKSTQLVNPDSKVSFGFR